LADAAVFREEKLCSSLSFFSMNVACERTILKPTRFVRVPFLGWGCGVGTPPISLPGYLLFFWNAFALASNLYLLWWARRLLQLVERFLMLSPVSEIVEWRAFHPLVLFLPVDQRECPNLPRSLGQAMFPLFATHP